MQNTPKDSHNWTVEHLVSGMLDGQADAITAVRTSAAAIADAVSAMQQRIVDGGRLIFAGAGTSGRIAAQDAAELPPTFNWPRDRALVLIAGGLDALHTPVEAAEDNEQAGAADMQALNPASNDIAIGLAASGTTPYTIAALNTARETGALTIALFNRANAPMASVADHPIALLTGAEFVNGSTRLAAGTAQKIALNMLTTGVMVRLGRVYEGHMVEMPPTNAKLHARAIAIVADVCGCDKPSAKMALEVAGHSVKLAIVMVRKGLDAAAAQDLLDQSGGVLCDAL